MSDKPTDPVEPAEIGIVLYPGVQLAAVHGLTDIFVIANRFAQAREVGGMRSLRVTRWQAEFGADPVCVEDTAPGTPSHPDFIVIPLTLLDRPPSHALVRLASWLRDRHAEGATLGSVCSGAFILAETGLLDGRVASTHWVCAEELRQRFPGIRVNSDMRIVDHGDVVTVGGFMAWIDMGLRLVERFLGPAVGADAARFLLDRPAEEAQYLHGFSPRLSHGDAAILRAQHAIHACDGRELSLTGIAASARLERRTLLRRFLKATGMTPLEYSRNVRMARARELLEYSNKSLKEMAWELGYEDPGAFGRAFRRTIGMSAADYRRRFGQVGHAIPARSFPRPSPATV